MIQKAVDVRPPPLHDYRKKRDPERTPEPFGGPSSPASGRGPAAAGRGPTPSGSRMFVVQKHVARRLHYDLRLEMDGVLKSWAVPKGPSVRPEEKRLAVHVEDHPIEYADFEGVIPPDNYGAGAVIVWDRGWYRPVKGGDPLDDLARGKLEVEFFGYKLRGRWTLARMSRKEKEWLLIKKADAAAAQEELTERYPESIVSGLTVEGIRDLPGKLATLRARLEALKAPRRDFPAREQPLMLAALAERPPSGKEWLFEIKYDGVRVLASRAGDRVELYGRSGQVITGRYPEVAGALRRLPVDRFVIDGEIVALDESGKPSFQRLQARIGLTAPHDIQRAVAAVPVVGIFFDCLALDGRDVRRFPLLERKELLNSFLPALGPVSYGDHVLGNGEAFFEAASAARLEGIVAKKIDSRYVGGRSREWIKVKCQRRQEFVIGGYTDPQGSRRYFGALHVGLYEGTRLLYVSKVGTGFDERTLKRVWERLHLLSRSTSPFDVGTPAGRGHHWVEPKLVCEVRFTEWTQDGGLRHPAFLGLRDDKNPQECRRESVPLPPMEGEGQGEGGAELPPVARPEVKLTNPKKVFWPAEGYTKADLVAYYESIAPLLLPYLRDRPLVLTRYPDGIAGKSFFQKDAPEFIPAWVRTERIYSKDAEREIDYFIVNDAVTLRYVANLGTIPLHLWSSRLGSLDRPDWLILDLDPKGAPFTDVVKVARGLHAILEEIGLPDYVKTSGATGLHILIPLGARYTHEEARTFARLLALLAVEAAPEISTLARPLRAREGKVYIDFGQNGHGRTIVAPFSVRPLPGAPASCPLRWEEVTARLDPARFTIQTLPRRFAKMADPLAPVLAGTIDMAAAIARIEQRLGRPHSP
ncbi:MAG: DNA ligase D [Candidatus Rokubacteria bacterium]|nr:DNA ligase D [Candidatus Rokubacteria bacterium]